MFTANPSKQTTVTPGKDKEEILMRHFIRFWGDVGHQVVFRRPKKPTTIWTVTAIEQDVEKVLWSKKGTPNYIQLKGIVKDKWGKEEERTVWTCENQLRALQPQEKRKFQA
jgi:hypothetical protein